MCLIWLWTHLPSAAAFQPEQHLVRRGQAAQREEHGLRQQLDGSGLPAHRGHKELQGAVERGGLPEQGAVESAGLQR